MEPFDNLEYFKYIFPVVPYHLQPARPVYHQPHCDVVVPASYRQVSFFELEKENIPFGELEKPKKKKRSRYSVYTHYRVLQKNKAKW